MLEFPELELERAKIAPDLRLFRIEFQRAEITLERRMEHPFLVLDHAPIVHRLGDFAD